MSKELHLKNGTRLFIEPKSFANGGEGDLFKIIGPISFTNHVVKIYKIGKRTKDRENKLQYLIEHRPETLENNNHHSIIWPNEIVYEQNAFCGFTMYYVRGIKLEMLCVPKLPKQLPNEWNKFDFTNKEGLKLRLKLCFNLAVAIYHVHKPKTFVLVDLKPENIIVQSNGLISIIDMDSIAVVNNSHVIYPPPVSTPDYTPAEHCDQGQAKKNINESWDRFSVAVIFYRLLCGIHPFIGSCQPPYDKANTTQEKIKQGLFVNGIKKDAFKIIPPPHKNFLPLNSAIQNLFKLCFDDGHAFPDIRPSADEWCSVLSPQDFIRKRKLPSQTIAFPDFKLPEALTIPTVNTIKWKKLTFPNIKKQTLATALIGKIFGFSSRDLALTALNQRINELKATENNLFNLLLEFENLLIVFKNKQTIIIENSIKEINQLKIEFRDKMAKDDLKMAELIDPENTEYQEEQKKYTNEKISFGNLITQLYRTNLEQEERKYNFGISQLQSKLNTINTQKSDEEIKRINNPTKLIQYKLNRADIHNFGFSTVKSLELRGIKTAADFVNIDSSGMLQLRNGSWVKVSGIGWSRASDLMDWKRKLDQKENLIIKKEIKIIYDGSINDIKKEIVNYEIKFKEHIKPFQLKYNNEKSIIDKKMAESSQNCKNKLNEIKQRYDKIADKIIGESKAYVSNKVEILLKDILNRAVSSLESNKRSFIKKQGELYSTIEQIKKNLIDDYNRVEFDYREFEN